MPDISQYALVYQIIADTARKYYACKDAASFYIGNMVRELKATGNEKYKNNKAFPTKFYAEMADILVRWFWEGFKDTPAGTYSVSLEYIIANMHALWDFHKKYLQMEQTHETIGAAMDESNREFIAKSTRIWHMVGAAVASLEDIWRDENDQPSAEYIGERK